GIPALETAEPELPAVPLDEKTAGDTLTADGMKIDDIDGKDGARVQLRFTCKEQAHTRIRIFVNGKDLSLINLIGGEGYETVLLAAGQENTLCVKAEDGDITLCKVIGEYLD
ncbi:MAG: hypothetical protein MJ175_09615, partial [Clostridia bacterium]|nr:hypothetical protein [Clostridia bacterium]